MRLHTAAPADRRARRSPAGCWWSAIRQLPPDTSPAPPARAIPESGCGGHSPAHTADADTGYSAGLFPHGDFVIRAVDLKKVGHALGRPTLRRQLTRDRRPRVLRIRR